MKQFRRRAGLLALLLICHAASWSQKPPLLPKIAPYLLREDLSLLKQILEANHPSLYWYTSKDSLDGYFDSALNSITDSLDEVQFKNKLAYIISKIRCGHTAVRFSRAYSKKAAAFRFPQFPLYLKAWDDSLVVLSSLQPRDPIFKRGTIITGINGMSNRKLLDTLFQYMSTDGYSENYKNQVVSGNFPAWYKTILGVDSTYRVSYIDTTGKEAMALVKSFTPKLDTAKKEQVLLNFVKPTRRQLRKAGLLAARSMMIDTVASTATIRLTTFTGGLKSFFHRSFKTIRKEQIKHLVIDLRENGGGKVRNSIELAKYLSKRPFRVGDSVVAISRKFKYGQYIRPSIIYWFAMTFSAHKMDDGLIHLRYYETKEFEPKNKYHFNGDVYLVQGGLSFSATTMFLSYLKGQSNVTLVGEETGGGYYGNSAMHIPTIHLPNTGLQVSLPMYRLVMDASRPKGHGIIPDLEVPPSSQAIKKGVDMKLQKIRELIGQKNATAVVPGG
ncbi:MAG: peptidase family [Sediminibacterium sp.]|nr:peptidase family [Sediminibacterium sp.]